MQESAAWRLYSMQRAQKLGAAGDDGGGQLAGGDEPALAVDVGQDHFKEFGALLDALRNLAPFAGLDEKRHMRERPGALARVPVGAVGNARVANMPVCRREAPVHVGWTELHELFEKPQPMRARAPVPADEFIRDAGQRHIARREPGHAGGRAWLFPCEVLCAEAHRLLLPGPEGFEDR